MPTDFRHWKHMFKLDPDRSISDGDLERVCLSGTDAIIVGGSSGVTFDNTVELLFRIRKYAVPCILEISNREAVVPGFDLYLIPFVLNSEDIEWMMGQHRRAVEQYGPTLPWEQMVAEAYLILNGQAEAARLTRARTELKEEEVLAYVRLADRLLRFPIVYLEYSGTFGDMELVGKVKRELTQARLFYGGGIDGPDKALTAAERADAIIVGNAVYDDLPKALETVKAVKSGKHGR